MRIISIVALSLLLASSACQKVQKVEDYPKHDSKLVVNCIFTPNYPFVLGFSKSLSPLDNAPFRILANPNAFAVVYEDGIVLDTLKWNPNPMNENYPYQGNLSINYTPKINHKYRIETYYPGFPKVIAEEWLPDFATLSNFSSKTTVLSLNENAFDSNVFIEMNKIISFNLNDNPIEKDYYILEIDLSRDTTKNTFINSYGIETNLNNVIFAQGKIFITESDETTQLNASSIKIGISSYQKTNSTDIKANITINRCGENAFKYLMSLAIAEQNQIDPFAEPTPAWNNIVGGFGIFGGYSINSRTENL